MSITISEGMEGFVAQQLQERAEDLIRQSKRHSNAGPLMASHRDRLREQSRQLQDEAQRIYRQLQDEARGTEAI